MNKWCLLGDKRIPRNVNFLQGGYRLSFLRISVSRKHTEENDCAFYVDLLALRGKCMSDVACLGIYYLSEKWQPIRQNARKILFC